MAYAAVISLKQRIEHQLVNSGHISAVVISSPGRIQVVYEEVCSLQQVLEEMESSNSSINRKMVNALDEQIRETVCELEDTLDHSHLSNQFLSQQDIHSFTEKVNKLMKAYIHELRNMSPEEDENDEFGGDDEYSKMVGLSDQFMEIKDRLTTNYSDLTPVSLKLFHAPFISRRFHRCAFVTIGRKYQLQRVLLVILKQLKDLVDFFPDDNNGSQILLTTRLHQVARYASHQSCVYTIRFLNKKESWDLLCGKVFGFEEPCCYELEKAGKRIAEKCEGLPLTIVIVANILSKAEKTADYNYLSQHLKSFFLYMGTFPEKTEVSCSKLYNLWMVEGITELDRDSTPEYFEKLVFNSLVMVGERGFYGKIKTASLHSSFWHLCNKEAHKNKFFYALNSLAEAKPKKGIKYQRRLCIRNSTLFSIKDAFESMESISMVRSLLCTNRLMLLTVLDALSIHFYEFPIQVLKLVQLRYLALWNLEYLIAHRKLSIVKSYGNSSNLPMEIWDMKELKHLQVMGSNLPNPCEGSFLPNLLTLLDVCHQTCTLNVLEKIPYLRKLGIRIELSPDNSHQPLSCFDHISHLHELKSLKCVVVNPILMKTEVVAPLSIYSTSLEKLTLNGFGHPWEDINKVSLLSNLQVLKLRCYAFRGPKWKVRWKDFRRLKHLLIEDSDLEQ
ncbi:hypothetical protein MIMGU_mgv1a025990mg [Erythranthe guttata]|uniref:NB-ARC domain-containing protein n=1 Tax=Erythranthe guttata TaxID=4155 RepID=A0A022RCT4_ERYGU|nr:hypothetical protein MIMGU_mgv1a025990mg [Erythranthe guttata]